MSNQPEYFDFLGMQPKKVSESKSMKRKSTIPQFSRSDLMSKYCTAKKKKPCVPGPAKKVQTQITQFLYVDGEEINTRQGGNAEARDHRIPVRSNKSVSIVKRALEMTKPASSTSTVTNSSLGTEVSSNNFKTTPARLVKSIADNGSVSEDLGALRRRVFERAEQALRKMHATEDTPDENLCFSASVPIAEGNTQNLNRTQSSNINNTLFIHNDCVIETIQPSSDATHIVYEIGDTDRDNSSDRIIETVDTSDDCIAGNTIDVDEMVAEDDAIEETLLVYSDGNGVEVDEMVDDVQPEEVIDETRLVHSDDNGVEVDEIIDDVQPEEVIEETPLVHSDGNGVEVGETVAEVQPEDDIEETSLLHTDVIAVEADDNQLTMVVSYTDTGGADTESVVSPTEPTLDSCGSNRLEVEQCADSPTISVANGTNVYCSDNFDQQHATTVFINDKVLLEDESSQQRQEPNVDIPNCNSVLLNEAVSITVQAQVCPPLQSRGQPLEGEASCSESLVIASGLIQVEKAVQLSQSPLENISSFSLPQLQSTVSCLNVNTRSTSSSHETEVPSDIINSSESSQSPAKRRKQLSNQSSDSFTQKTCTESQHKMYNLKKKREMRSKKRQLNCSKVSEECTPNSNLPLENSSTSQQLEENSSWDKSVAQFKLGLALDLELKSIFLPHGDTSSEGLNVSQSTIGHDASSDFGAKEDVNLEGRPNIQDHTSVAQKSTKRKFSVWESTANAEGLNNQEGMKPKSYPNIIPLNIYMKFFNWYNNEWNGDELDEASIENRKPVCSCACSLCDCVCHSRERKTQKSLEKSRDAMEEFFLGVEKWMQTSNRENYDLVQTDSKKQKVTNNQTKNLGGPKAKRKRGILEPLFEELPDKRPIKPPIWHNEYLDVPLRKHITMNDVMIGNSSTYRRSCKLVNENESQSDAPNLLEVYKSVHSMFNPLTEISNVPTPKRRAARKVAINANATSQCDVPIKKKVARKNKFRFYSIFSKKHRIKKIPSKPKKVEEPSSTETFAVEVGVAVGVPQNSNELPMNESTQGETQVEISSLEPNQQDVLQTTDKGLMSQSLEVGESHLNFKTRSQEQEPVELTLLENHTNNYAEPVPQVHNDRERITKSNHKKTGKTLFTKQKPKKQTRKKDKVSNNKAPTLTPNDIDGQSSELQLREDIVPVSVPNNKVPSTYSDAEPVVNSSLQNEPIEIDCITAQRFDSEIVTTSRHNEPTDVNDITTQNCNAEIVTQIEPSEINDITTQCCDNEIVVNPLPQTEHNNDFKNQLPDAEAVIHSLQQGGFGDKEYIVAHYNHLLGALNLDAIGEPGSKQLSIEDVYNDDDDDVVSVRNAIDEVQYQVDCAILKDSIEICMRRPDEEIIIKRLFYAQRDYLKNIMLGKVACARHKEFTGNAVSQMNMADFAAVICSGPTVEVILDLMTKEFNPTLDYSSRCLFRCYFWKVLFPEFAIKIVMDAYGISKLEAHRKIVYLQSTNKFNNETYNFLD